MGVTRFTQIDLVDVLHLQAQLFCRFKTSDIDVKTFLVKYHAISEPIYENTNFFTCANDFLTFYAGRVDKESAKKFLLRQFSILKINEKYGIESKLGVCECPEHITISMEPKKDEDLSGIILPYLIGFSETDGKLHKENKTDALIDYLKKIYSPPETIELSDLGNDTQKALESFMVTYPFPTTHDNSIFHKMMLQALEGKRPYSKKFYHVTNMGRCQLYAL